MSECEFTGTPTAVYRLYAADGTLLYAGITHHLALRMAQHEASQPWWPLVTRKTMMWYGSREAAAIAEEIAISTEQPQHNEVRSLAGKGNVREDTRTVKVTAVMTPALHRQLVDYADQHKWSLSTALVELALKALAAQTEE
jgi:predicted GIY-YIG superfamily endonuclease